MEKLNIIGTIFILEFVTDFLLAKFFNIKSKFVYLLFLQIPKVCINMICLELIESVGIRLAVKIVSELLNIVFLTESFDAKTLICMIFAKIVFLFSVTGFLYFVLLWINSSIKNLINIDIDKKYYFLVIFATALYIWGIFVLGKNLGKNRKRKDYLAKVSLNLNGKHMSFSGLIDSGNSLRDNVTRKSVILVSITSLIKYLSAQEISMLVQGCRQLKIVTVAGSGFSVPIVGVNKLTIETSDGVEVISSVLGFVDEKFENGKFDCLLPRDFI